MYNNRIVQEDIKNIISSVKLIDKLKNKTIIITGATGLIASYCMQTLVYLNDEYDFNMKIIPLIRNYEKLKAIIDFSKRKDFYPLIQDVCSNININEKVDYILHMASSSNPTTITKNPVGIIEANVIGTLKVLELARNTGAKVLFTSTREIYGKMDEQISEIKESDMGIINPLELRSCYPESKRMAENLLVSYAYQYGIKYNIVRIAHTYGPGMIIENDGRVMSDLIGNIIRNEDIVLKSNGEALRAFCYVSDCVNALFNVIISGKENEVYNISNEREEISIKDLANLLNDVSEKRVRITYNIQDNANKYVNFKRVKLNNKKISTLGWDAKINLRYGIERTIKYFTDK